MLATNRWRNWQPVCEKFNEATQIEPTKPPKVGSEGFEGTSPEETLNFFDSPQDELSEWAGALVRWLDSMCRSQTRFSTSLKKLHESYCEWVASRNGVSCTHDTFAQVLEQCGFLIVRIDGVHLVSGLALQSDIQAFEELQEFTRKSRGAQ